MATVIGMEVELIHAVLRLPVGGRMHRTQCLGLILSGFVIMGCTKDVGPCNSAFRENDQLIVQVLAPYSATLSPVADLPSCVLDDVRVGDQFNIQLLAGGKASMGDAICEAFECPLDFPAPALPTSRIPTIASNIYGACENEGIIRLSASCSVGRFVNIYAPNWAMDWFAPRDGGTNDQPIVMTRSLNEDKSAECSDFAARFPNAVANQVTVCADQWLVSLTKH